MRLQIATASIKPLETGDLLIYHGVAYQLQTPARTVDFITPCLGPENPRLHATQDMPVADSHRGSKWRT